MKQQLNSLHEKVDALTQLLRSDKKSVSEKPAAPAATPKAEPTFTLATDKGEANKKPAKKAAPAVEVVTPPAKPAAKKKTAAKKK